tara:strand:+ start:3140 stop:3412 length:273 start_codon:yes stop_codon:yes gene_type:complete
MRQWDANLQSYVETEEEKEYTEKYMLSFKSNANTVRVSFEAEKLDDVLEHIHTFLNAVGFTYVGKLTAISRDEEKEWETSGEEDGLEYDA